METHPLAHIVDERAPPDLADYWQAVGRFMTAFSRTEAYVHIALRAMAHTSDEVSKAVFSGTKIDLAMSFIGRILDACRVTPDVKNAWNYISTQLGGITRIRNQLVHYGADWAEDRKHLTSSNRLTALLPERAIEIHLTPKDLRLMCADLMKIEMHLHCQIVMPERASPWQQEVLQAPWLYKLPELNPSQNKNHATSPKPSPPPQPSQG